MFSNLALAFPDKPAPAEQRITNAQADATKQREGAEPAEFAPHITAIGDRKPFHQSADGEALNEGCNERAAGKTRIPEPARPLRLPPVFEGDATRRRAGAAAKRPRGKGPCRA